MTIAGGDPSTEVIDSLVNAMGEMAEISSAVAAAIAQRSAGTDEIARNIAQAAHGTGDVFNNIASVDRAAQEAGTAAHQIESSLMDLSKQSEFLRRDVRQFLDQVRVAA